MKGIWQELDTRFCLGRLAAYAGAGASKGVTGMRSFVVEPMRYGRLFLAGGFRPHRPAHGSQGTEPCGTPTFGCWHALSRTFTAAGSAKLLDTYSGTCLRRVWKVQRFSW